jgi:tocopherol cyclase
MQLINRLNAFFHPEQFQGWGKRSHYFEGWYFKVLNAGASSAFAFIPGIAMDHNGNKQAFIQVLDGKAKTATYHKFSADSFIPVAGKFVINIDENFFSEKCIKLNLPTIKGELHFNGNVPWPKSFFSPGIMGPFSFVPFMECYHGIVSMDHGIDGHLNIDGSLIDFNGGRGYIEKDWGRSFPSAYVWMQTNHFSVQGISLKASVANIPWLGSSFIGFIAGLWLHDRLIQFNTYNGTSLRKVNINEKTVELVMHNNKHELTIVAHRDHATALASPINGLMDGRIEESMSSIIDVELIETNTRKLIFSDKGYHAGLEVAGKIDSILK